MTKRKIFFILIIWLIILTGAGSFSVFIVSGWDFSEEKDHKIGKDTILYWNNGVFQLGHYSKSNYLEFHHGKSLVTPVLKEVITYKVKNDKLFVVTGEGYAVADREDTARVLVTVPDDEFINGYHTNEEGEKIPYSRYIDDPHITYLESFDDFSEEEQKQFNKMTD
ncbi:MAG: hypothetical protein LUD81_08260 [Clostridiales bacterium]|nr:hypothetical protein [Clostridiales bacterium]